MRQTSVFAVSQNGKLIYAITKHSSYFWAKLVPGGHVPSIARGKTCRGVLLDYAETGNTAQQTDAWEVFELVASSWDAIGQLTQRTHAEVGRTFGGQQCRRKSAKARRSTCFSQTMLVLRQMETLICSMCRTTINVEYTHTCECHS